MVEGGRRGQRGGRVVDARRPRRDVGSVAGSWGVPDEGFRGGSLVRDSASVVAEGHRLEAGLREYFLHQFIQGRVDGVLYVAWVGGAGCDR